jgi:hypothetical protein
MVAVSGKALDDLKRLGHLFEGHSEPVGPVFVDQPKPFMPAMGSDGTPITTSEVLASSSEHVAAQHDAALAEAKAEEKSAEPAKEHAKR